MANFLPAAQKICWFSLNSLFNTISGTADDSQLKKKEEQKQKESSETNSEVIRSEESQSKVTPPSQVRRRFIWPLSFQSSEPVHKTPEPVHGTSKTNSDSESDKENAELIFADPTTSDCCGMGVFKPGKNYKGSSRSRLPTSATGSGHNGSDGNEKGGTGAEFTSCKCVLVNSGDIDSTVSSEDSSHVCKRVLSYSDAPAYLRFNPHITGGYRGMLSPMECVKSLFWWTNETLNIWSHLLGWIFFVGLSVYDALGLLEVQTVHPWDRVVFTLLLTCFQACMLLSSLYHIFCCHSEVFYRRWLSADLLGVSLTLLAIYISGIYYAFSCVPFWLNFYLVTVGAIFVTAMVMQILPMVSKKEMVTEERFHWRLIVFGGWACYGVVPTFHWAYLHGGMASEAVALLLPRIFGMYVISGFAFLFYVARIPEKIWPGLVNFVGSSHQIWHILIFVSLYHWHNTGLLYLNFRATHPCSEEYAALFPNEINEVKMVQYI